MQRVLLFSLALLMGAGNLMAQSFDKDRSGLKVSPWLSGAPITASNPMPTIANIGTATGGSQTTLVDATRNYGTDVVKDKMLRVRIGEIDYFRKVVSHTADTLTFAALPGASSSCVIGDIGAGQITISVVAKGTAGNNYTANIVNGTDNAVASSSLVGPIEGGQFRVTVDAKGAAGNAKTVIVTAGVGNNVPLSAALVENALTVTLATGGEGAVDDAANTAALVVAAVDAIEGLSAAVTVAGVVVAFTPAQAFTGGVDGTRALAAALVGSVVTVTLARDATGTLDDSANTATAIAAAVDALAAFSCSMTGSGGVMTALAEPATFAGGVDVLQPIAGTVYQLMAW